MKSQFSAPPRSLWRFFAVDSGTLTGRVVARAGLSLLGPILLCGGLFAAWHLAFAPLLLAWQSRDWPLVPARLESARLVHGLSGTALEARYCYRAAGKPYCASRYGLYVWRSDADTLRARYVDLLYQKNVRAYVNPARPEEALLDRRPHWPLFFMFLPALLTASLGGALCWAAMSGFWAAGREAWRRRACGKKRQKT
ncbi:MAG: DUF3592 domain-containing protein [Zoogloeaceae bacterium]|jgi:hypothetical protein|nr:DUF3592 domain-containing protein [Zoogloeaceae bacterium]